MNPINETNSLLDSSLQFPLKEYGFVLDRVLNNENRWDIKIVCSILDKNSKCYVSTTYHKSSEYLKLIETTEFLRRNNKVSPKIIRVFPRYNTVVCDYIGNFLAEFLLENPSYVEKSMVAIFNYLKDINSIGQSYRPFIIPSIIQSSLRLPEIVGNNFGFLTRTKTIIQRLKKSDIKFTYGCGIEDPHIWNFRIVRGKNGMQALTTDFDYFQERANYFWELGYLYATFRWFKKFSFDLSFRAEKILLSLLQKQDLKSEFMFCLGVLSSYCGYRDSLLAAVIYDDAASLREQYLLIQQLDERVFHLGRRLLSLRNKYYSPVTSDEIGFF